MSKVSNEPVSLLFPIPDSRIPVCKTDPNIQSNFWGNLTLPMEKPLATFVF